MKLKKQRFKAVHVKHQAIIRTVLMLDTLTLVLSSALVFIINSHFLQPVLLGTSVFLLPTVLFYWRASRYRAAQDLEKAIQSLYVAQGSKFLLTTVMFAYSFITMTVSKQHIAVFFIAYMGLWFMHHLLILIVSNRQSNILKVG